MNDQEARELTAPFRLRVKRSSVLRRLLALQLMGAYVGHAIYRLEADQVLSTGDRSLTWLGVVGLGGIYASLTALMVARLVWPVFFTVLADGSAQWMPFFSSRALTFPPSARFAATKGFLVYVSSADHEVSRPGKLRLPKVFEIEQRT